MKRITALLVIGLLLLPALQPVRAQVPYQFNYQGKFISGTNLVNASTAMVFRLYNTMSGGAVQYVETQTVAIVDGLYSARVGANPDYGTLVNAATNQPLYLEVQVGGTTLTPREQVVSVLYSIKAAGVITGSITSAMLANGAVTGPKIAGGTVSNAHIAAGSITSNKIDWTQMPTGLQDGDSSSPLLSYDENGAFATVPNASGDNAIAQGDGALAAGSYSAVGGGRGNAASGWISTVAGGERNTGAGSHAAIGGGLGNIITGADPWSSTIAGGYSNAVKSPVAAIGGGLRNTVTGTAATVVGGQDNVAGGRYSLAAGHRAKALHDGSFVWADSLDNDFESSGPNQFMIRAAGGVGISCHPEARLHVMGWESAWEFPHICLEEPGQGSTRLLQASDGLLLRNNNTNTATLFSFRSPSDTHLMDLQTNGTIMGGNVAMGGGLNVSGNVNISGNSVNLGDLLHITDMRISGKVGIGLGTADIQHQLQVKSSASDAINATCTSPTLSAIAAFNTGGGYSFWGQGKAWLSGKLGISVASELMTDNLVMSGNALVYSDDAHKLIKLRTTGDYLDFDFVGAPIYFNGDGNTILVMNSTRQNVGIGTADPDAAYKLDVNGAASVASLHLSSDARLKENIHPIENALDKVCRLRGVEFDWRSKEYPERNFDDRRHLGLIAQEVEEVIPEVVTTGSSDGMKSVEYANLVAVLVEAVKELKSENESLKQRISTMEEAR